jgi:hypothetical protein
MKKRSCFLAAAAFFLITMHAQAANPVPYVNQPLAPASIAPGSAGFTLSVTGTGFVSASVVKWNGSPRSTTYVSSMKLQAAISASDVASAGSARITVNSGGPDSNFVTLWIASPVSTISFASHQFLRASAPADVLTADFNGDQKLDLALANGFASLGAPPHVVGVMAGNGNGTFQPPVNYKTVPQTSGVASGDFNGDGNLDLAVSGLRTQTLSSSWAVSILLGNGDGTFQPAVNYAASFRNSSKVIVADFNADGKLDVAAIDADNTSVIAVLLGNGNGTFQPPVTTAAFGEFTAIGDFNGDGILDLAGTDTGGPPEIALGNGDGTFQPPTKLTSGGVADSVTVADFNGDGKLDVAFAGVTQVISVCLGNGDGTFQPCMIFADDPTGNPSLLKVADLNGDGNLDLIDERPGANNFSYLLGNGDGSFGTYNVITVSNPSYFDIGDINGDGRPDLVFIGGTSDDANLGLYRLLQHP